MPKILLLPGGPGSFNYMDSILEGMSIPEGVTSKEIVALGKQTIDRVTKQYILPEIEERTILVGHSFGSFLALWVATQYPENISGLILTGLAPLTAEDMKFFAETIEDRMSAWSKQSNIPFKEFKKLLELNEITFGPTVPDEYALHPYIRPLTYIADRVSYVTLFKDYIDLIEEDILDLSKITIPVRILQGDYDPLGLASKRMYDSLSDVRWHVYAAGHMPWLEEKSYLQFREDFQKEIDSLLL